ncbi:MAG: substrate-binding domain-containing protein [Anaerolineae bacterium]|nr:substrate-binding domain-containing protein [Anaerolineae bacterium]
MSRSRIVFFVIIGLAVLVVLITTLIQPQLERMNVSQNATATAQYDFEHTITLTINFGTEKEKWLTDATTRFMQANPNVKIELDGQGSMESYQALSLLTPSSAALDKNYAIPVLWSPASTIQVNLLNATNPDLLKNCKQLVISPTVLMVWEDRAKVFEAYYKDKGGITFENLVNALTDPSIQGSWEKLGGKASWGLIKIGHTNPLKSNSGVMSLITFANNYYKKASAVTSPQVTDAIFREWLKGIEDATTRPFIDSTGTLTDKVINQGPAAYDFVVMYEALAIENYKNAVGRQNQTIRIIYPPYNLFSDHPMCLVNHPSITDAQKRTATRLMDFLLSKDIQQLALTYGWRPADTSIPIFGTSSDSPFEEAEIKAAGVGTEVGQAIEVPDGATINDLLTLWTRIINN